MIQLISLGGIVLIFPVGLGGAPAVREETNSHLSEAYTDWV